MKAPVRVLLLEMPQLLRGILERAIQIDGDCELWSDSRLEVPLTSTHTTAPDIVMLGLTVAQDAPLVPALLARWPGTQVMTVTQAGEEAVVYELRPRRRSLGQMSPAEIVGTLREAVLERRNHLEE